MQKSAVFRVLVALTMISTAPGIAQEYPSRPIRMIAPFPPGGGVEFLGRILGQKMAEHWGQQVVVDNRGGGSAGNGSMLHLATALLARRAGIEMTHIPYKGGSLALNALLSNEVNLLCMTTSSLKPQIGRAHV